MDNSNFKIKKKLRMTTAIKEGYNSYFLRGKALIFISSSDDKMLQETLVAL